MGTFPPGTTSGLMTDHVVFFGTPGFLVAFVPCCGQYIPTEWTVGVGEPANAILSAKSDPAVLIDQETDGGLRNYFLCALSPSSSLWLIGRCSRSFQFGAECLGQHEGSHQVLDLGDGNGPSKWHINTTHPPDLTLDFRERNCRDTVRLR
jgi:hypothetical protein